MTRAERLAQGFIEATTEYDFTELPTHVRAHLLDAAEAFIRWSDPVVIMTPAGIPDHELEAFLTER